MASLTRNRGSPPNGGFIAKVKAWPDVELLTVTGENRDRLPGKIAARLLG